MQVSTNSTLVKGRRGALGIGDGAAEGEELGAGDGIAVEGIGEGALDGREGSFDAAFDRLFESPCRPLLEPVLRRLVEAGARTRREVQWSDAPWASRGSGDGEVVGVS